MNTTPPNPPRRRALLTCTLLLLAPALTGCGGGGGSAPATALAQAATVTLSGTLLDASGAPLVGYKVSYTPASATPHARRAEDVGGTISTLTDGQGRYTLSIPASEATPGATLSFYDTSGTLVQSQTITLDPSQPVQTTVTTVTAPPAPTPAPVPGPVSAPPPPPTPPI